MENNMIGQLFDVLEGEDPIVREFKEQSKAYIRLMTYYKCAMMEIETKFNVLNEEYSLRFERNPISQIKTRLKSPRSIAEKLKRKNLTSSLDVIEENISDIAGVRVICSTPDDVYTLADSLISQDDVTCVEIKDYIKNPKPNGYRSLHVIVEVPIFLEKEKRIMRVEIQLRSIAMDFWASLEHQLRYKKDTVFTEEMAREMKECAEISAQLDARMAALRRIVFNETAHGENK